MQDFKTNTTIDLNSQKSDH